MLPVVPLQACLEKWLEPETIDFRSPALAPPEDMTTATKTQKFSSFPPFIVVQVQRYYVDDTWTPKKLEVKLEVPHILDLESFRASPGISPGSPLKEGEIEMPDIQATADDGGGNPVPATVEPDEGVVAQLASMGFDENGCRKAAIATANNPEV